MNDDDDGSQENLQSVGYDSWQMNVPNNEPFHSFVEGGECKNLHLKEFRPHITYVCQTNVILWLQLPTNDLVRTALVWENEWPETRKPRWNEEEDLIATISDWADVKDSSEFASIQPYLALFERNN